MLGTTHSTGCVGESSVLREIFSAVHIQGEQNGSVALSTLDSVTKDVTVIASRDYKCEDREESWTEETFDFKAGTVLDIGNS
jgi:hypothetical protein